MFDTFVTLPMQQALTFFYTLTQKAGFPSYGIAIIMLTAAIKLLLYPLTVKQVKSMKAVQEIQPKVKALQENVDYDMEIIMNADLWELGDRLQNKGLKVDLILGHSKGRFIAMDNNVPLVRVGFPIYDRAGYYHYSTVGYEGARVLTERMANVWFNDMEYTKNKEWLLGMW